MIQDRAALLWVINLGCIDLNQWYATLRRRRSARTTCTSISTRARAPASTACSRPALDRPRGARALKMPSFVKTTGSKGLHVYVPIVRGPEQKEVWTFAKALAQELAARHPALMTAEYRVAKRPPRPRAGRLQPERLGPHARVDLLGPAAARGDRLDAGDVEGGPSAASASRTSRRRNVPARVAGARRSLEAAAAARAAASIWPDMCEGRGAPYRTDGRRVVLKRTNRPFVSIVKELLESRTFWTNHGRVVNIFATGEQKQSCRPWCRCRCPCARRLRAGPDRQG